MCTGREVRVTDGFFDDLDRQLGDERGPNREPSATDFLVMDLPAEQFANHFESLPEAYPGEPIARVAVGTGSESTSTFDPVAVAPVAIPGWSRVFRATLEVVSTSDYLALPDAHLDPVVAAAYDDPTHERFSAQVTGAAVAVLSELAGEGTAVEFAVGTGRLALPLARAGVRVLGIDFSQPMLAELQKKEGAEHVSVTVGDMTQTRVCDDAALVYLVFNTIMNLRTQPQQVACFRNAAAHLAPGGCFVIENMVPQLRRLPPGETIVPFDVSAHHLGFEEYVDLVNQISISHHYHIDGERVRTNSPAFRYVWPSELDLMAELAGMTLEARWADWDRSPFTGESQSHVSVWRKL